MRLFASMIVAAATLTAVPAMAHEGRCMWDSLTPKKAALQQQILAAPTEQAFSDALPALMKKSGNSMFAACKVTKEGRSGAMWAFAGYASTLWLAPRLGDQWTAQALDQAFESVPAEDLRVLTGKLAGAPMNSAENAQADAALSVLYKPFGRSGPLDPQDNLDKYFASKALEYGGEMSIRQAMKTP